MQISKCDIWIHVTAVGNAVCTRYESVRGSEGIAPFIPNLGTAWESMVSFTPLPLYPLGTGPRYPLIRKVGGPHERSGHSRVQSVNLFLHRLS